MSHLAVSLLGPFQVRLDELPLTAFATDKGRALLAFLAVEANHLQRRETLMALFWPDCPQAAARNSLRQALFQLRHTLKDSQNDMPHLLVNSKEMRFDPASDYWLDVQEQEDCLGVVRAHNAGCHDLCPEYLNLLKRAANLYQGDFLAGFTLPDCPGFGWWQLTMQEVCHRRALEALSALVDAYEAKQEYDKVIVHTLRKIELEPWRETAYQHAMRALALCGQRGEAIHQYDLCCQRLYEEMGIEPSAETIRLYEQIRAGTLPGLTGFQRGPGKMMKVRSGSL